MYLPLDRPPVTDFQVQELIVEYNSSLDFVDNMSVEANQSYYWGTENYLNLNDEQFDYLETVYYPIFEEEERQEEQRRLEEQQRELEQRQQEINQYVEFANEHDAWADKNTPMEDVCHLGGGVVVQCSKFFD